MILRHKNRIKIGTQIQTEVNREASTHSSQLNQRQSQISRTCLKSIMTCASTTTKNLQHMHQAEKRD
jgi:hypothetical protein